MALLLVALTVRLETTTGQEGTYRGLGSTYRGLGSFSIYNYAHVHNIMASLMIG